MTRSRKIKWTAMRLLVKGRRTGTRLRRSRRAGLAAAAGLIVAAAFAVGSWVAVPLWVGGKLSAWAEAETGRSAEAGRIGVNPFTLTVTLDALVLTTPAARVDVDSVTLDFAAGALLGRTLALDALVLDGPRLRLGLMQPAPGRRSQAEALAATLPTMPLRIDDARIDRGRIEWLDPSGEREPVVLDGITLRATGIDDAAAEDGRYELDVRDVAGGALAAEGRIAARARRWDGRAVLENVAVAPIAARVFSSPSIGGISSGSAELEWRGDRRSFHVRDASLRTIRFELEQPGGAAVAAAGAVVEGDAEWADGRLRFAGRIELDRAEVQPDRVQRFMEQGLALEAERITASGVSASVARIAAGPATAVRLHGPAWADTLALRGPHASLAVGAAPRRAWLDAALSALSAPRPSDDAAVAQPSDNAAVAERSDDDTAVAQPPGDAAVAQPPGDADVPQPPGDVQSGSAQPGAPPRFATGRIEIEGGVFEIADAAFGAGAPVFRLDRMEGSLARADGDGRITAAFAAALADADRGTVEWRASLVAERADELTLAVHGVPGTILAPYAERYARFTPGDGVLDAAVEYRRAAGGIDGTLRVRAAGVEVGGTDEPELDLAFALLDAPDDDSVVLEAGFHGRAADDPRYVVAAALRARLDALAAAPFDVLGRAAGVDGARLESVPFEPGEAAPAPSTDDVLNALADALRARPRVGVRVIGAADRSADREALATQQVELHVTLATAGPRLVARPQPVDFDSPRHRDVLDEFAGERLSDERRETIASYFTRSADGRVVADELGAYYRALFAALVENEQIPDNGIERLGRYRARAIADALVARGIGEQRLEIAPAVIRDDASSEGRSSEGRSGEGGAVHVPLAVFVPSPAPGEAR